MEKLTIETIKKFKNIPKRTLKELSKYQVIAFMDCEYHVLNSPGKTRPNTLRDPLELIQISCIKLNLENINNNLGTYNVYVKPNLFLPTQKEHKKSYEWFEKFTKIKMKEIMKDGASMELKDALDGIMNFTKNVPIVIMKGDAEVIFNNGIRVLNKVYNIERNDSKVFILSNYRKEMYESLGIPFNDETKKYCSGELHLLLEKYKIDTKGLKLSHNGHNALHDSKSMSLFLKTYFDHSNEKQ